jgi:two-component system, NtrC family, response regulator AtoC
MTTESTHRLTADATHFELVAVSRGATTSWPIPPTGELLIGRTSEADVRLDGPSVSRRHAVLRVQSTSFAIEDLGSANGTFVRGQRAPANHAIELTPGESAQVGEYVLVVQPRWTPVQARHVWPHEYFEARVIEQCERWRQGGTAPFHIVRVRVEDSTERTPAALAAELGPADVLAQLAPGTWGVLLTDGDESGARALATRIERALDAATDVIGFPRDATSAGALMSRIAAPAAADDDARQAPELVLRSPAMRALDEQLDAIAKSTINVLILGETGVGKDVMTVQLHARSPRATQPLVRLNCAALAEPLLESELFGHERGAFTGAVAAKPGLLETANGGTVFFDEVGELTPALQAKLLQVIENREVLRVGGLKPREIDVRFIAATNRDLEREVEIGRFRSDLYYRLAGFTMVIPPLRDRREDILPLAAEWLERTTGHGKIELHPDVAKLLLAYPWPGNIRELRNVIERAVVLSGGVQITLEHLPTDRMRSVVVVPAPAVTGGIVAQPPGGGGSDPTLGTGEHEIEPVIDLTPTERAERLRILDALSRCAGNQSKAAAALGWSRSTLLNRLDAYRIRRPRKRPT